MQSGFLNPKKTIQKYNKLEYYDIISCNLLEVPGNIKYKSFISDYINKSTWDKSTKCPFTNRSKEEVIFSIDKKYIKLLKEDTIYQKLLKTQKEEDKKEEDKEKKNKEKIRELLNSIKNEFESNMKSDNIFVKNTVNIKKFYVAFHKEEGILMRDYYTIINLLNDEDFKIIHNNTEYNLYYKKNDYQRLPVIDIELYKKCCSNWRRCIN